MFSGRNHWRYFAVGASGFECIERAMSRAGAGEPDSVIDVPSGFGRVLRFMRAAWPHAQITAVELQHDAATYCAQAFNA
jgi:hypothetical protein